MTIIRQCLVLIIILTALFSSCSSGSTKRPELIILERKEIARKEGALYIKPATEYVLLENETQVDKTYIQYEIPLILKDEEINEDNLRLFLNKLSAMTFGRNVMIVCSQTNIGMIQKIISNQDRIHPEFKLHDRNTVEFYYSK